jgi:hypothetical protein
VFDAPQEDNTQRVQRRAAKGPSVEVWVGLSEIVARGLQADVQQSKVALTKKASDALSDTQRIRAIQFSDEYEASRRFLRLADISDTGFGIEASEKEATGIAVGDLLGLRLSDEEPCVLGRVVRRVPGQTEGQVTIGVRAISNAPQALTVSRSDPQGRPDDDDLYIYVPGDDNSGAQDAFLVPEKILQEQVSHVACIGDDIFTLQFNRVRRKGRGWALAGFEILEAKRIGALAEAGAPGAGVTPAALAESFRGVPKFELVDKDKEEDYSMAWDREVRLR